jgi:hypothetical protein
MLDCKALLIVGILLFVVDCARRGAQIRAQTKTKGTSDADKQQQKRKRREKGNANLRF